MNGISCLVSNSESFAQARDPILAEWVLYEENHSYKISTVCGIVGGQLQFLIRPLITVDDDL